MGGVKAATASFGLSFSGLGGAVVGKKVFEGPEPSPVIK